MKNKKNNLRITLTAAALVGAALFASSTQSTIPARMLFPLYIAPGTNGNNWNAVISANTYGNIDVILNPSNGPGSAKQTNYVNGIARLKAANVGIYGYVHSTYGDRSIADVKADVDKWVSWYGPLTGIFIDEAEYRAGQGDEGYYAELYAYIKERGMLAINNPGTGTNETYLNLADTTCIFESSVTKTFTFPSWGWNYPSTKFCYLAWGASVEQMRTAVDVATKNNIEYVYITGNGSDHWNFIPPYLAEEAALLAGGGVVTPTASTMPTVTKTPAVTFTATYAPIITPTVTRTPTPSLICVPALSVVVCNRMP